MGLEDKSQVGVGKEGRERRERRKEGRMKRKRLARTLVDRNGKGDV